jgi:Zn-dependent protease
LEQKLVDFAIQYSVLLFALSFHESAHAWSALKFGDTTARDLGRISLNPLRHIDPIGTFLLPILFFIGAGHFMFGWAKPTPVNLSRTPNPRKANLVVSGAGPVSNLLLCAVGVLLLVVVRRLPIGGAMSTTVLEPLWEILVSFTMVNFGLGIFNLLPIPPLDGSTLLTVLLPPSRQNIVRFLDQYGIFLLLGLLILAPNLLSPIIVAVTQAITRLVGLVIVPA